jgi:hypothetical protein
VLLSLKVNIPHSLTRKRYGCPLTCGIVGRLIGMGDHGRAANEAPTGLWPFGFSGSGLDTACAASRIRSCLYPWGWYGRNRVGNARG